MFPVAHRLLLGNAACISDGLETCLSAIIYNICLILMGRLRH